MRVPSCWGGASSALHSLTQGLDGMAELRERIEETDCWNEEAERLFMTDGETLGKRLVEGDLLRS